MTFSAHRRRRAADLEHYSLYRRAGWQTAKEIAFRLGGGPARICYWARKGYIPSMRFNQRVVLYQARSAPPLYQRRRS